MAKSKQTFETADGREFNTAEEAEQHEQLYAAEQAFESARRDLGELLAKREKTADGHPIDFGKRRDFYAIFNKFFDPRLVRISIWWVNWDWNIEDCRLRIHYRPNQHSKEDHTYSFYPEDLYVEEAKAVEALLTVTDERIQERQETLDKMRANKREIRAQYL